jgi:hypothetical protein
MEDVTPKFPEQKELGYKPLQPTDQMPNGAYQGRMMKDVPAAVLLWLADNDKCTKQVRMYITEHWNELCKAVGRDPKAVGDRTASIDARPQKFKPRRK